MPWKIPAATVTTLWIGTADMIELQLENIANEIENGIGEFLDALTIRKVRPYSGIRLVVRDYFTLALKSGVTPSGSSLDSLELYTVVKNESHISNVQLMGEYKSPNQYANMLCNALDGKILESIGDILPLETLLKSRMYRYFKMQLSWNPNEASEYLLDGKGPRYLAAKHFLEGELK